MAKRITKKSTSTVKRKKATKVAPFKWKGRFLKTNLIPCLIIFLLGLAPYLLTLSYEYVLDDTIVITKNTFVKQGFSGLDDIFKTESFQGYFQEQRDLVTGARYRPLSIATFAIENGLWGNNPLISHLINALLYGLTCLLIFRFLVLLFPALKRKWWLQIPFWAAALYALHPIHTEAVANIKGRDEIMAMAGAIGTMILSLRYLAKKDLLSLILSGIVFFLALLSKENALTFLAILPLTFWVFTKARFSDIFKALLPLLIAAISYLIIRYQVIGYFLDSGREITDIMNNPFYGLTIDEKLATVFFTLLRYIKLLFFPHPLAHDYYPYAIPIKLWSDGAPLISLIIYLILPILSLFLLWKKRKSVLAYSILFYLITLSIVSNIPFTVGTLMNERFLFMPSLGFCILAAWFLIDKIPSWFENIDRRLLLIPLIIISALYTLRTVTRIPDWKDTTTLNRSAVEVSKNSARANLFMGTALYEEYKVTHDEAIKASLLDEAEYYINRAHEIIPAYGYALHMKSGVLADRYKEDGDIDKLLSEYRKLLMLRPEIDYLNQYMDYLNSRIGIHDKLVPWYYDVGYNICYKKWRHKGSSLRFLEYGYSIDPSNVQIKEALKEIYTLIGDKQKAAQF
jgi:hypothetical protein